MVLVPWQHSPADFQEFNLRPGMGRARMRNPVPNPMQMPPGYYRPFVTMGQSQDFSKGSKPDHFVHTTTTAGYPYADTTQNDVSGMSNRLQSPIDMMSRITNNIQNPRMMNPYLAQRMPFMPQDPSRNFSQYNDITHSVGTVNPGFGQEQRSSKGKTTNRKKAQQSKSVSSEESSFSNPHTMSQNIHPSFFPRGTFPPQVRPPPPPYSTQYTPSGIPYDFHQFRNSAQNQNLPQTFYPQQMHQSPRFHMNPSQLQDKHISVSPLQQASLQKQQTSLPQQQASLLQQQMQQQSSLPPQQSSLPRQQGSLLQQHLQQQSSLPQQQGSLQQQSSLPQQQSSLPRQKGTLLQQYLLQPSLSKQHASSQHHQSSLPQQLQSALPQQQPLPLVTSESGKSVNQLANPNQINVPSSVCDSAYRKEQFVDKIRDKLLYMYQNPNEMSVPLESTELDSDNSNKKVQTLERPWFMDLPEEMDKEKEPICNSIFGRWYKMPTERESPLDFEYLWDEDGGEEDLNKKEENSSTDNNGVMKVCRPTKVTGDGKGNKTSHLENQISRIYNAVHTERISPLGLVLNEDGQGREIVSPGEDSSCPSISAETSQHLSVENPVLKSHDARKNDTELTETSAVSDAKQIEACKRAIAGTSEISGQKTKVGIHASGLGIDSNVVSGNSAENLCSEQNSLLILNTFSLAENNRGDIIENNESSAVKDTLEKTAKKKKGKKWKLKLGRPKKDKSNAASKRGFGSSKKVSPIKIRKNKGKASKQKKGVTGQKKQKKGSTSSEDAAEYGIVPSKKQHKRNLLGCFINMNNTSVLSNQSLSDNNSTEKSQIHDSVEEEVLPACEKEVEKTHSNLLTGEGSEHDSDDSEGAHLRKTVSKIKSSRQRRRSAIMLSTVSDTVSESRKTSLYSTSLPRLCSPSRHRRKDSEDCTIQSVKKNSTENSGKKSHDHVTDSVAEKNSETEKSTNLPKVGNNTSSIDLNILSEDDNHFGNKSDLSISAETENLISDINNKQTSADIVEDSSPESRNQSNNAEVSIDVNAENNIQKTDVMTQTPEKSDSNKVFNTPNEQSKSAEMTSMDSVADGKNGPAGLEVTESPKTLETPKLPLDINKINQSNFFVNFHGRRLLCCSIFNGKYFIMRELLKNCFASRGKRNHFDYQGYKHIFVAKERDLNILYKELPEHWRDKIMSYLAREELLNPKTFKPILHIGVIHVNDAKRLFHFFNGVKTCQDITCVTKWTGDAAGRFEPSLERTRHVEVQTSPKPSESTKMSKVGRKRLPKIPKEQIREKKRQESHDATNQYIANIFKNKPSRFYSDTRMNTVPSYGSHSESKTDDDDNETSPNKSSESVSPGNRSRKRSSDKRLSKGKSKRQKKSELLFSNQAGEESDSTIPYVEENNMDVDMTDVEEQSSSQNSVSLNSQQSDDNEDYIVKGGVAELFGGLFRFLIVNDKRFYPFHDLCHHFDKDVIFSCIRSRQEKFKAVKCSQAEINFLNPLEPNLPALVENATIVEEDLLFGIAKENFKSMFHEQEREGTSVSQQAEISLLSDSLETSVLDTSKDILLCDIDVSLEGRKDISESADNIMETSKSPKCSGNGTTEDNNSGPTDQAVKENDEVLPVNGDVAIETKYGTLEDEESGTEHIVVVVEQDCVLEEVESHEYSNKVNRHLKARDWANTLQREQKTISQAMSSMVEENASLKDRLLKMNATIDRASEGTRKYEDICDQYEEAIDSIIKMVKKKKRCK